jgi:hypothetical protein
MRDRSVNPSRRRNAPLPQWYDELDLAPSIDGYSIDPRDRDDTSGDPPDSPQSLAYCFLRVSRLGYGGFELLSRYEAALWRQAAQVLIVLQSAARR